MGKILVVFGSKSNKPVYDRVIACLKRLGADFEFRVCSAHRTPEVLDKMLKEDYSVVIAGAGLAAHLPGVIASKTTAPVIGIPCRDNFGGMDSLLSIIQMPPGIPVLSVGIGLAEDAAESAAKILDPPDGVSIVSKAPYSEKAAEILEMLDVQYKLSGSLNSKCINLRFEDLNHISEADESEALTINCPVSENVHEGILNLSKIKSGLWVGLNRAENAAIAAAEILGRKRELDGYRKQAASAVIDDDRVERC
ncbi:AIR carboxylase family protein [Candidatus Woesearchaeota archaeon]|nr:AIR carboxylase family protein [Candidatus Woesearchaeota archaeon]